MELEHLQKVKCGIDTMQTLRFEQRVAASVESFARTVDGGRQLLEVGVRKPGTIAGIDGETFTDVPHHPCRRQHIHMGANVILIADSGVFADGGPFHAGSQIKFAAERIDGIELQVIAKFLRDIIAFVCYAIEIAVGAVGGLLGEVHEERLRRAIEKICKSAEIVFVGRREV